MSGIKDILLNQIAEPETSSGNKVTIVGVGQVGMACAFSILTQVFLKIQLKSINAYYRINVKYFLKSVSSEIVLIDVMQDKLTGEMLDLQHGSAFMKNAKINASVGMLMCIL